ncbi:hypothetical protein cypCar_00001094 [Cyprinus carpio]|nr:hypothetical protein cypCar_00001094 [Cyprinus carpio]
MGITGYFELQWKCLVVVALRLLFLVPAGVPARSGESYLKDNITVRQGDSAVLKQAQKFRARNHLSHSTPAADEVLSVLLRMAREGAHGGIGTMTFLYKCKPFTNKPLKMCNVDNKVSRVAWLNRTTILFTGNEKWSLDPRVVLLNTAVTEYSIKIINVNLYDEGPYVCSILTNKKPESTKVHLIVQEQCYVGGLYAEYGKGHHLILERETLQNEQVPARIVNISTDVSVNEGSNVSLMCLAIGRPEPSIFWKFRSSKGDGKDPPVISRARSTGTAVGQKGVLWCEASAIPLADFQWYKGERRLFNGLNRVKIENKGKQSMLTFFNVSEEDYGNYTCVAMNTLGITNASIILYAAVLSHSLLYESRPANTLKRDFGDPPEMSTYQ